MTAVVAAGVGQVRVPSEALPKEGVGTVVKPAAPVEGGGPSAFAQLVHGLGKEINGGEAMMRSAVQSASGSLESRPAHLAPGGRLSLQRGDRSGIQAGRPRDGQRQDGHPGERPMTTAVSGSTGKPVTGAPPPQAVPPKYATPPTVSFRSLLLGGDAVVADPLLDSPLVAPPLPLLPQLPVQQAPHGPAPDPASAMEPQVDPDVVERVAHGRDDNLLDPSAGSTQRLPRPSCRRRAWWSPSRPLPRHRHRRPWRRRGHKPRWRNIIPALVRRVQWGGDGRKGTVRMELGAGALAGATLQVSSDRGRVSVQLDVPPGVDAAEWRERITTSLAAKNIATDQVEVT